MVRNESFQRKDSHQCTPEQRQLEPCTGMDVRKSLTSVDETAKNKLKKDYYYIISLTAFVMGMWPDCPAVHVHL